ncbi:MAG: hypothetical protein ACREJ3_17890, partial [Polyangiaceae bacterium]
MRALAMVEGAISRRVLAATDAMQWPNENAFGSPVVFEHGADIRALARRCGDLAAGGERVALIARAADLTLARSELAVIASRRLGLVVHVIAEAGGFDPASLVGIAPALALDDLPWGMLLGAGAHDAIDLALIARRAAEDSGCPFFVVHERTEIGDAESVVAPVPALCEGFLGAAGLGTVRPRGVAIPTVQMSDPGSDRAFAERVPFALASAMRELESFTGRRHDFIERSPGPGAGVALVGAGLLGRSLLADVIRRTEGGQDVVAVRVVAWRPFPAPQIVKALGRALAVTVLERVDQPL